jgi:hypothetical protein
MVKHGSSLDNVIAVFTVGHSMHTYCQVLHQLTAHNLICASIVEAFHNPIETLIEMIRELVILAYPCALVIIWSCFALSRISTSMLIDIRTFVETVYIMLQNLISQQHIF